MLISNGNRFWLRRDFSKIPNVVDIPNLIEIQKKSYSNFLQKEVHPDQRENMGLQSVFHSVFPIKDFNETCSLEFISYMLGEPKYNVDECQQRGMTYAAPVRVILRLIVWNTDSSTGERSIRDMKQQEVYFGEIPLMTDNGTFIINGTERVIVNQLHRSPGAFFDHDSGKTYAGGKILYSARIIPYRGSWIDMEFDSKDILFVRIDRKRKFPVTMLIQGLGFSIEDLLNYYYKNEMVTLKDNKILKSIDLEPMVGQFASENILHPKTGELLIKKKKRITQAMLKKFASLKEVQIKEDDIIDKVLAHDVVDQSTGETLAECNEALTVEHMENFREHGIDKFQTLIIENSAIDTVIRDTLLIDKATSPDDAIMEIYRILRPGDPPTPETAKNLIFNYFFNPDRYDLSRVGRLKLNHKLNLETPLDVRVLSNEDILEVIRYLIKLKNGFGDIDDIDHLGNRRVRTVGELVENHYRIGLVRMERAIRERMSLGEIETLMPHELVNVKPVSAVIKEFFGSSQLSQFMDQTNPLSEITHKRRLSALGPGGLTRERAGFEVRDVHPTHYGRICPVETPEGPNIGLIASLSSYARVNEFGFIETPYRLVKNSVVSSNVRFLSALDEEDHAIAQANAPVSENGKFINELVSARIGGEPAIVKHDEIDLMDVSPKQLVSVAASLIPFLENDDANRALMGSNMQRQAVPLLRTQPPLVGTGMEHIVAKDSGVAVTTVEGGTVVEVDSNRIIVRCDDPEESGVGVRIYNLTKYQRSNQNTCINQKPIVRKGEVVQKDQIIADGMATSLGELALGRNVLVAFMPWGGYNFEDSILISENIVKEDAFTSIHIEEFECVARDTKLGKEEITRDIPNVGEEALKDLDESGIIRIGAEVNPGDILVGKITPKGETQLSPEEKLLRAIFGEKAGDVRDTSLKVPPGVEGIVINAKVFSRRGTEKDERTKEIEGQKIAQILRDQDDELRIIESNALVKIKKLLLNQKLAAPLIDEFSGAVALKSNTTVNEKNFSKIQLEHLRQIELKNAEDIEMEVGNIVESTNEKMDRIRMLFEEKINQFKKGDELPPGVIKMVKVYVAIKRKLSVGDKMAGRHGNKGVLSRILPEEDMPYTADGTPVDIVLNPLGVPSRMNVGQILETHLGWAAKKLGEDINQLVEKNFSAKAVKTKLKKIYNSKEINKFIDSLDRESLIKLSKSLLKGIPIATPVFDGAIEDEIDSMLDMAELPKSGQTTLYDGRTGEQFSTPVTVGIMYMLKLHHLVDDKIHARSIGPYSLVTQQPLGGKAQFGGQRLGEMEVWAIEAYGAAYSLQEFLTVKSDDTLGRTRMYESIVKGDNKLEPGLPESFNVLVKELQSLCLNIELIEEVHN